MDTKTKVRENRLRRVADRRGFRLEKSRRRDPGAIDYGTYSLYEGRVLEADRATLDQVESIMESIMKKRARPRKAVR